ncbi:sulfatase [Isoptericola sp. BMS4]|uniref:sulfatase family protein n=1 Tax=Isoptericola sp. BMS4 TaxID=2527875 RepID=UPI00142144EE|nr:sulfatase [Isoptericola sp. BMS4]
MGAPPNLVIVMADQLRAAAVGTAADPAATDPVATPRLDRLAATGCRVTHAVSSYPVCSPHRAMFLTGRPPAENGVTLNVNSETAADGVGLRDGLPTWASVLRDHGYRTGYVGKWHLEPPVAADEHHGEGRRDDGKVWDAWSPPERRFGFDFWHAYGAADRHLAPHYWVGDAARSERLDVDRWSAEHEVDVAIDFVTRAAGAAEPFALMVSLNPPHQPFDQVPERYRARYAARAADELLARPNVPRGTPVADEAVAIARDYFAAVTGVDDQVGRLVDALADAGTGRDTIVVLTSDHGMQLGSHGLLYKNVPYEESMRVPLVLHCPGRIPAGPSSELVGSLDVAPTLLGLAGLSAAVPAAMRGADRSAALTGRGAPTADPAAVYYRYASRSDPTAARGLRTRNHKLVATWHPGRDLAVDFYDLVADPYERSSDPGHPAVRVLARRLLTRLADDGDDWPGVAALRRALDVAA